MDITKIPGWNGFTAKHILSEEDVGILISEASVIRGGINKRMNLTSREVSGRCNVVLRKVSDWVMKFAIKDIKQSFSQAYPKFDIDSVNWKPVVTLCVNTEAPTGADPVRGWHLDRGDKLYAGMLYVNDSGIEDMPKLYYGSDPQHQPIGYVEHKDSTLVIWANTPNTWHGVTSRPPSTRNRVMLNIYAESEQWVHSYHKIDFDDPKQTVTAFYQ